MEVILLCLLIATIIVLPIYFFTEYIKKKQLEKTIKEPNLEPIQTLNNITQEEINKLQYQELKIINNQLHEIDKKLYTQNRMIDTISFYFGILLFIIILPTIIKIFAAISGANILYNIF